VQEGDSLEGPPLKFWELTSIMRAELAEAQLVALREPEWRFVAEWIDNLAALVKSRDRAKLEFDLPDKFVHAALRKSRVRFFLTRGRNLRSRRISRQDKRLSALGAFERFGGHAMDEALERGSVSVATHLGYAEPARSDFKLMKFGNA
jgi:hypothetical protein